MDTSDRTTDERTRTRWWGEERLFSQMSRTIEADDELMNNLEVFALLFNGDLVYRRFTPDRSDIAPIHELLSVAQAAEEPLADAVRKLNEGLHTTENDDAGYV